MIASFGKNIDGKNVELDLKDARFILLVGKTGSGKSVFHTNLYKDLMARYTSDEIGFVFLDMTAVDFVDFPSKYLLKATTNPDEAIKILRDLPNSSNKKIIIHIEESDMVTRNRAAVEAGLDALPGNVSVTFSTSRIEPRYLEDWKERVDLTVAFKMSPEDSEFLIGDVSAAAFQNPGERVMVFNGRKVYCRPF